jgi:hypothetical protein
MKAWTKAGLAAAALLLAMTSWAWDVGEADEYDAKAKEAIAEFIFFEDGVALADFKRGNYELGAQAFSSSPSYLSSVTTGFGFPATYG